MYFILIEFDEKKLFFIYKVFYDNMYNLLLGDHLLFLS